MTTRQLEAATARNDTRADQAFSHVERVDSTSPRTDDGHLALVVDPARVVRWLTVIALLIVVVGATANITMHHVAPRLEHPLARLMSRFDLVGEPSLPAWYSSLGLLASGILLAVVARHKTDQRDRHRYYWWALSMLFMLLALDEAVMIHEMADAPVRNWLNTTGIFSIAWIIPGTVFVTIVGLACLPFLISLRPRTRRLFLVAGAIYVTGAIGMEMPGGLLYDKYGFSTWHYISSYAVEELLEMLGVATFIYALLDHIRHETGTLRIDVRRQGDLPSPGPSARPLPEGEVGSCTPLVPSPHSPCP